MGIFDAIKEAKRRHNELLEEKVRQEELRKKREREEQERRQRETDEKERVILDKLASGELMQSILSLCREMAWFGESQGSWDSNLRQFIVTPVAVIINNHDTDVLFRCLEEVAVSGGDQMQYVLHREFKPVMDPGGNWVRMPTSQTIDDDFQLKKYNNDDSFHWNTILFESYGYGAIEDPQTLRYFTMALHREALKLYRGVTPSQIRKNAYGFYGFEFKVEGKKQKSIL